MSATMTPSISTRRPAAVISIVILLIFLGATAVVGSIGMLSGIGAMAPPEVWLDSLPLIDSWLLPGLVLGLGFGIGSLLTAWGVVRRPVWTWSTALTQRTRYHWSWIATMTIGAGQALWISLELALLPDPSILQAVYLPVGVALFVLPMVRSVRGYLALD